MVTGVSPKHIFEVLSQNQSWELEEYLSKSTPWFKEFVEKWLKAFRAEYEQLFNTSKAAYEVTTHRLEDYAKRNWDKPRIVRKAFAEAFIQYPDVKSILFALLDGKDPAPIIWKLVKPMYRHGHPMVDGRL